MPRTDPFRPGAVAWIVSNDMDDRPFILTGTVLSVRENHIEVQAMGETICFDPNGGFPQADVGAINYILCGNYESAVARRQSMERDNLMSFLREQFTQPDTDAFTLEQLRRAKAALTGT